MNINQLLPKYELSIQAGADIYAGVKEHFKDVEGGHECQICGEVVKHPRAAMAHMGVHHKDKLEHAGDVTVSAEEEVKAGGPGSGRHKTSGTADRLMKKMDDTRKQQGTKDDDKAPKKK